MTNPEITRTKYQIDTDISVANVLMTLSSYFITNSANEEIVVVH